MALLAVLLGGIESRWIRTISFARLVALNVVGGAMHLPGDVIAVWSLPLLWPWATHDVALQWTGDFDLVVLVFLLLVGYFWWMPGWAGLGIRG